MNEIGREDSVVWGPNDVYRQMKEELRTLEGKLRKLESDKAGWQGAFIMLGFVVLLCAYSWVTTPRPSRWDVNYEKPVVTLVTFPHWWSGAERTDYAWGTADTGEEGWLLIDKDGHVSKYANGMLRDDYP